MRLYQQETLNTVWTSPAGGLTHRGLSSLSMGGCVTLFNLSSASVRDHRPGHLLRARGAPLGWQGRS